MVSSFLPSFSVALPSALPLLYTLDRVPAKENLILSVNVGIAILPIHVRVIVVFSRLLKPKQLLLLVSGLIYRYAWDEWCLHFLVDDLLPREAFKPRVILYIFGAVQPESVRWLALD